MNAGDGRFKIDWKIFDESFWAPSDRREDDLAKLRGRGLPTVARFMDMRPQMTPGILMLICGEHSALSAPH
jgi:hypothetical protein